MKGKLLAALLSASMLAPAAASAEDVNPFDDVPKDHWAYQEIEMLAKDGLVEGYQDGTFRGGEEVTRYEMAALVGRAISIATHERKDGLTEAEYEALTKLGDEFHHELSAMGVRLSALEKYKSNVGFYGDVRVRAIHNRMNKSVEGTTSEKRFDQRIRLGWWSEVASNFTFTARLRADNVTGERREESTGGEARYDSTGKVKLDLAEGKWQNGPLAIELGRFNPTIGQGGIWSADGEGSVDGFYATYTPSKKLTVSGGYGSVSPSMWDIMYDYTDEWGGQNPWTNSNFKQSTDVYTPAFLGNVHVQASPAVEFTLGTLQTMSSANHTNLGYWTTDGSSTEIMSGKWALNGKPANYRMEQYAIGVKAQLAPHITLSGEWMTNRADRGDVYEYYMSAPATRAGGTSPANTSGWAAASQKKLVPLQKNGWWLKLTGGNYDVKKAHTFDASLYYLKLGNWAIDSHFAPHGLPIRGGNGLGLDGEKGCGIGFRYMLAPYVELSGSYFRVKPYDSNVSEFDSYCDPWQFALNYSF